MEGDPTYEASQELPDFPYARYAELIGLRGIRVDDPEQRRRRVGRRRSRADRPVVLEAITDPEVPPLPPHITLEQAQGARPRRCSTATRARARMIVKQALKRQARRVPARPMSARGAPTRAATRRSSGSTVAAYTIPTDAPESDGTFAWDATTIVVVRRRRPAASAGSATRTPTGAAAR